MCAIIRSGCWIKVDLPHAGRINKVTSGKTTLRCLAYNLAKCATLNNMLSLVNN